ncbi:hypothetical protein DPMN_026821 [Dreissena polymorpha]|uniref:Uncharacterized protein n=1 Tax=Dreissena polymorpha TaxID=45954 RepID=A0A9D4RCY4_DREPO|nr:hypothetical protein DPMN_026821 [Dreissena polymorpha]
MFALTILKTLLTENAASPTALATAELRRGPVLLRLYLIRLPCPSTLCSTPTANRSLLFKLQQRETA